MTYALGRSLSPADETIVRDIAVRTQGHRIQDLIAEIVLSPAFRGVSP
jgi:hypothetical protein